MQMRCQRQLLCASWSDHFTETANTQILPILGFLGAFPFSS